MTGDLNSLFKHMEQCSLACPPNRIRELDSLIGQDESKINQQLHDWSDEWCDDEDKSLDLVYALLQENHPMFKILDGTDLIVNDCIADLVLALQNNTNLKELKLHLSMLDVDGRLNPLTQLVRSRPHLESMTLSGSYDSPEDYSSITSALLGALQHSPYVKTLQLNYLNLQSFASPLKEVLCSDTCNLKKLTIELDPYQSYKELERHVGERVTCTKFSIDPEAEVPWLISEGLRQNDTLEDVAIIYVDSEMANAFLSGLRNNPNLKSFCISRIDKSRTIDADLIRRFRKESKSTLQITECY